MIDALVEARAAGSGRLHRVRPRRVNAGPADGRWALLEPSNKGEEDRPLAWLGVLLERYGILTRELVELDPWAPAWADLAPLLLKVETYNGEPALQSPVASRLAELGFVRDYPGMTYYGAWAKQVPQSSATAVPQGG